MPDAPLASTGQLPADAGPWYADGLQFRCTQCGNCCTGQPGFVWVEEEEIRRIAEHLGCSVGEVRLLHTRRARGRTSLSEYANGDCTFLDPASRRCRIYPARPDQCRTWPFWRANLLTPESWKATQAVCPGTSCGDIIPLEEVQRIAERSPL